MISIDLNADLGEGGGADAALIGVVTSANVACGAHAGQERDRRAALLAAADCGVVVGAHPGYPDREHFGRRALRMPEADLRSSLAQQLTELCELAERLGVPGPRYLKPHGALYHRSAAHPPTARLVLEVATATGLPVLLHAPGGATADLADAHGVRLYAEGFADRRYAADGTLVSRSAAGAILDDPREVAEQAVALAMSRSLPLTPAVWPRDIRSICLHGDAPHALARAACVRDSLCAAGVGISSFLS